MNRRSLGWMGIAAIALIMSLLIGSRSGFMSPTVASQGAALAQAPADETTVVEAVPTFSGVYEDPQGTFQIGILEGTTNTTAGGSPLFTVTDGSLSYSVVQLPLDSEAPLPDVTLVTLANQALNNGEGFQTQTFTTVPQGLQINWTGRLSQGSRPPQPVSGSLLANQQGATVYLLVVAALEDAAAQVPQTLVTLAESWEFL